MARKVGMMAEKGSQRDIQLCFNDPKLRDWLATSKMKIPVERWLSPMADDRYSEYSDKEFLDRIGLPTSAAKLEEFWPARGPVWDGLAIAKDGTILLFEAKSHVSEFFGMGSKAKDPNSVMQINKALRETAEYIGAVFDESAWTDALYQMANRLAFLYLLNVKLGVRAKLIYLIFLNDTSVVSRPESEDLWRQAIEIAERYILRLPMTRGKVKGRLFWRDWVKDVYVDIRNLGINN